jgi:hypothetical protein
MSFPSTTPTLPVPVSRPLPVPGARPPMPARQGIGALARRALPAVRASLAVVAAGLATEYALRSLARRVLEPGSRPQSNEPESRAVAPLSGAVMVRTRTVVTEFVIRERIRRVR